MPDATQDVLDSGEAGGKAIRGGAFRTAGYVLGMGLSLASVPFMIRHLGAVDYGRFITVMSVVFIIQGVSEAGLTNLAVREYAVRDPAGRERFLANMVGLRFALTVSAVLVAAAVLAVTGARSVVVVGVLIAGLGLLIQLAQQPYVIPLTVNLSLGWVTILDLIRQTALAALTVALVVAGAELTPFFWINVATAVIAVAATVALVGRHGSLRPAFDLPAWREMLRETLPYALAAAVGLIYFRIAVVLMSYVSTEQETGWFSAAFRITEVVVVVPWLLVSSAFPILARAARDDEERLGYALQRLFEVSLIIGAGMTVALAAGAEFAVGVVAGPGFEESVGVLRLQAASIVTAFLVATWLYALLSLKLYRALLLANSLAALTAIGGTILLAPSMGAHGAAIATVAAEAVLALAAVIGLNRAKPVLRPRLAVLPKVALATAAGTGAAFLLAGLHPVLMAAGASAAFAAVALVLRAVPPELFAAILRRPIA